jgi:hypothetical protein
MRIFILLLFLSFLFACSSTRNGDSPQPKSLQFGSGGGVSGLVSKYRLEEDGNLYKTDPVSGEEAKVDHLRRRKVRSLFQACESLAPCENGFDEPENYYYFLMMDTAGESCGWVWGEQTENDIEEVKDLYQQLIGYLPG